jgi:RNA ligase (TIGR02306 family)
MELRAEVVKLGPVEKHPNADNLAITTVFDYPVITKLGEFKEGDLAIYVPIDAVVPQTPEWEWLHLNATKHCRVKAKRLRGVFSMGLIVPAREGYEVGDDVTSIMGITKYEPAVAAAHQKLHAGGSQTHMEVPGFVKYTDIENLLRWPDVLEPGEEVVLMEKIHGANFRCGWTDGKFHIGSHSTWRQTDGTIRCPRCKGVSAPWWRRLFRAGVCPKCSGSGKLSGDTARFQMGDVWNKVATQFNLKERLRAFPDLEVFGEVYGPGVQDLTYGVPEGSLGLCIFDVYNKKERRYLDFDVLQLMATTEGFPPLAPIIAQGLWHPNLKHLAEGKTMLNDGPHLSEGFVVRPVKERFHPKAGRVIFKCINPEYLLRKGGTEGK